MLVAVMMCELLRQPRDVGDERGVVVSGSMSLNRVGLGCAPGCGYVAGVNRCLRLGPVQYQTSHQPP